MLWVWPAAVSTLASNSSKQRLCMQRAVMPVIMLEQLGRHASVCHGLHQPGTDVLQQQGPCCTVTQDLSILLGLRGLGPSQAFQHVRLSEVTPSIFIAMLRTNGGVPCMKLCFCSSCGSVGVLSEFYILKR